jgi:hypothetical protein
MNDKNHAHQSMLQALLNIARDLEPLPEKKNPRIAAACGFISGGVGLGLYLQSWKDFLIPFGLLMLMLILGVVTGEILLVAAPFVWAAYGHQRVKASNAKLEQRKSTAPILNVEVVATPPPIPAMPKISSRSFIPFDSRLKRLDDLLREGVLSQTERDTKRAQILAEL